MPPVGGERKSEMDEELKAKLETLLRKWRGRYIEKTAEANNALPGSLSLLHIEANAAAYVRCYADLSDIMADEVRSTRNTGKQSLDESGQGGTPIP